MGGAFLNGLRQLVKDVLLMANTLTATIEYVVGKAAAAVSGKSAPALSSDEYNDWKKMHPGEDTWTFESILKDKIQKAADTWAGKFEDATNDKLATDKNESKKATQQKTLSGSGKSSSEKSIGVEKVASSTRNINISIENLVKEITFSKTESWRETEAQFTERVKRALLTAVNDVNILAQ